MTVWIYINTKKQVGDPEHLVIATPRRNHRFLRHRLIIRNRPPPCSLQVVVLPVLERPEKTRQPEGAEGECQRHEEYQDFHQQSSLAPRWARSAFKITSTEEPDMAAAATSGVARPAMASGTASKL